MSSLAYVYHWPPNFMDGLDDWEINQWYKQAVRINKEQERASKT